MAIFFFNDTATTEIYTLSLHDALPIYRQGESGPGRGFESVYDHEANHSEKNRHDGKHSQLRDEAAALADFFPGHLANRFSVPPNRAKKNDKILHAARKRRSGNQPESAGQIAKLRGERRSNQRARTGNGGEMVAEENPFVGGHEVAAIVVAFAGSGARIVERKNFGRDKSGIEPIGHQITAHRRHNKPGGVERLAAMQRDGTERAGTQSPKDHPASDAEDAIHFAALLDLMNCAISAFSLASDGG